MRRPSRLISFAAGVVVLLSVLICSLLALVPRDQPVLTRQEAEQQAVEIAHDEYAGTITNVTVRQLTRGQMGTAFCDPVQKVLVPVLCADAAQRLKSLRS